MRFEKNMTIEEALEKDAKAREVFAKYGMGCIICSGALMETIEEGAQAHGIDADKLVEDLNNLAEEEAEE